MPSPLDTTITIRLVNGAIELDPDRKHNNDALADRGGQVFWKGDGETVTDLWVVAVQDTVSPFVNGVRALSNRADNSERARVRPNAANQCKYWVFCATDNGVAFVDPIIVIRDPSHAPIAPASLAFEVLAEDARRHAAQAEEMTAWLAHLDATGGASQP